MLLPFTFGSLKKNFKFVKQEYKIIFFIGSMGCGVCGAFPFWLDKQQQLPIWVLFIHHPQYL